MTQRGTSSDPVGGSTPGRRACEVVTTTLHIFRPLKKKNGRIYRSRFIYTRTKRVAIEFLAVSYE